MTIPVTHARDAERLDVLGTPMTILTTVEETAGAYEVVLVDAERGGELVPHRHPWQEIYFVVEGTMEVQVGRRVEAVGPGALVTLPARCLHAFRVTSDRARFLHLSFGPGAVDAFRDLHAHVPHEPTVDDLAALAAVTARHGIDVALPDPATVEVAS